MDMARTMTNVIGNCLATVIVARWEGEFREASDVELVEARKWDERVARIRLSRPVVHRLQQ